MSKRILVAEDDKPHVTALTKKLGDSGYTVLHAGNGKEALEMALTEKPDLMLLDIVMPEMDGLQVLEKIREDDWGRGLRVIILTNMGDDDRKIAAKKLNATDYLVKSDVSLEEVMQEIQKHLS